MKPVIIAEKPKQAQAYADALKPSSRKDGFIEIGSNQFFPDGAYLTWAIGHLVELAKPEHYKKEWERWDLKNLPIKPETFEFVVSSDKQKQFNVVEKLLKETDQIVIATDCDREGENIAWSIIKKANAENKTIKRLWINSLEIDAIQQGFKNLRNGRDYYNSYLEAQTRQISDWLIGMNASPLYTLLLRSKGVQETFPVGRVQTPTLYMIYQREKEIENFVQKSFYELIAEVNHPNGRFTVKAEGRYDSQKEAIEKLAAISLKPKVSINGEIAKVEKSLEKEHSPTLYTMSGIQTKANKLWKYSPAKVTELVQGLYDKKLLTYPRTDTPYITENEFEYLKASLADYQAVLGIEFPCAQPDPQKRYVNSEKVAEHYAIVPTKNIPTNHVIDELSTDEKNIYLEVVRNTISMFHEPYLYNKTVIEITHGSMVFKTTGKEEVQKGWKELYPTSKEKDNDKENIRLPDVREGDSIQFKPDFKKGKTTKPERLTEGDLIPLMIHAGKLLDGEEKNILKETEGIGTEATRANIIETLKRHEYIVVKKNLVYTTTKGVILCEAVDGTLLSSPSLTAKWESFLQLIGKGERKQDTFLNSIYGFIDKLLLEVPQKMDAEGVEASIKRLETDDHIGKCPNCEKGFIVDKEKFYGCTDYKNGCKQTFSKKLLQKSISETQLKKLLAKGKTDLIKGFKGKKPFDAFITLEIDTDKGIKRYKLNFKK